MKKIILLITLFFAFQMHAQNSDEQQLKDLIKNSFDDIFSQEGNGELEKYYTSDFLLLEVGEVWDMDRIKRELSNYDLQGRKRINEFEFIQVKISANTGWVAYHNKATFEKDEEVVGEVRWLESATAVKTEEGWKLDMLHSTRIVQTE